jgi:ABC-type oligopeptide transport system substrate-binding subunit
VRLSFLLAFSFFLASCSGGEGTSSKKTFVYGLKREFETMNPFVKTGAHFTIMRSYLHATLISFDV